MTRFIVAALAGILLLTGCGRGVNPEQAVVYVLKNANGSSGGTGVHVTAPSGNTYILTNKHVCNLAEDGQTVWIKRETDERPIPRKILEKSKDHGDLCVVEPLPGSQGLEVSEEPMTKDETYTVLGHPLLDPLTRRTGSFLQTAIITIFDYWINSIEEEEKCSDPDQKIQEIQSIFGSVKACLKTARAEHMNIIIYPGNSGSPVLSRSNKIVALIFAARNYDNAGFAVPLDLIQDFLAKY